MKSCCEIGDILFRFRQRPLAGRNPFLLSVFRFPVRLGEPLDVVHRRGEKIGSHVFWAATRPSYELLPVCLLTPSLVRPLAVIRNILRVLRRSGRSLSSLLRPPRPFAPGGLVARGSGRSPAASEMTQPHLNFAMGGGRQSRVQDAAAVDLSNFTSVPGDEGRFPLSGRAIVGTIESVSCTIEIALWASSCA
jgi:hypothetical protein